MNVNDSIKFHFQYFTGVTSDLKISDKLGDCQPVQEDEVPDGGDEGVVASSVAKARKSAPWLMSSVAEAEAQARVFGRYQRRRIPSPATGGRTRAGAGTEAHANLNMCRPAQLTPPGTSK